MLRLRNSLLLKIRHHIAHLGQLVRVTFLVCSLLVLKSLVSIRCAFFKNKSFNFKLVPAGSFQCIFMSCILILVSVWPIVQGFETDISVR